MSNFNKNGWVSLAKICEERQLVIDAETGKKVLRPAYFSSMNAMIEGAFQFARETQPFLLKLLILSSYLQENLCNQIISKVNL